MKVRDMQPNTINATSSVITSPCEVIFQIRNLQTREVETYTVGAFTDPLQAEDALKRLCGQDWKGATFLGGKVQPVVVADTLVTRAPRAGSAGRKVK